MKPFVYIVTFLLLGGINQSFAETFIEYNDNISASIDVDGEIDLYTFEGTSGDKIIIRMRDAESSLDACLELITPSGILLAEDCGSGGTVRIDNIELTESGLYTIKAKDNNDNDIGSYGLSLQITNNIQYAQELECGEEMNVSLDITAQINAYHFEVEEGDAFLVQMKSLNSHFESQLEIYDPFGNLVSMDKSSSGGLVRLDLNNISTGSYTLLVLDDNGNDLGDVAFNLQFFTRPSCTEIISCGQDMIGDISSLAAINAYSFEANAGEVVVIQMRDINNSVEAQIELYDPFGNLVDLDESKGNLARIGASTLLYDGNYTLLSLDSKGNDLGSFALSFEKIMEEDCNPMIQCADLGEKFTLSQVGEIHAYRFNGQVGDMISISMIEKTNSLAKAFSTSMEPTIELYAPNGDFIQKEKGYSKAVISNHLLQQEGSYTVLFSDANGNDTGDYTMDFDGNNSNIEDNVAPEVFCNNITVNIGIDGFVTLSTGELNAGSFDKCSEISMSLSKTEFNCNDLGENIVMLTVTDQNGNQTTCQSTVTVLNIDSNCFINNACASAGNSTSYEWIEDVTIGSIENTSGNNNGYADFTYLSTTLQIGENAEINLTPGFVGSSYKEDWRVWIDWNQDGDFEDANEEVISKKASTVISKNIIVPNNAMEGATIMRVSMKWGGSSNPCENFSYGEVEDYRIQIIENQTCGSLPLSWNKIEVGTSNIDGFACYDEEAETYTIGSSGYDIFEEADNFEFVYDELCGDGEISTYVSSLTNTGTAAGAGLMMRSSFDEGAKNATILVTTTKGILFQARVIDNGFTEFHASQGTAPHWIKLRREGNLFMGFVSDDGINWEPTFFREIAEMEECIKVGLVASSYNVNALNIATFENVIFEQLNPLAEGNDPSDLEKEISEKSTLQIVEERFLQENSQASSLEFNIYPNPTSTYVDIEFENNMLKEGELLLFDQSGKQVYFQNITAIQKNQIHLDITSMHLVDGNYILLIQTKNQFFTKRLVVKKQN